MSTPQDPYDRPAQPGYDPVGPDTTQDPYAQPYVPSETSYTEPYNSGSYSTGGSAYTEPYGSETTYAPQEPEDPTKQAAKEEARQVKQTAADAGSRVADTAKAEAGNVAAEAKQQAKGLVDTTAGEVRSQANAQQQRLAGGISALAGELETMANSEASGPMADLARRGADKGSEIARWLETRDSSDLLDEVRAFARRRPWAFLAGAAAAGVVVGRFGKGLAADKQESKNAYASQSTPSYSPVPSTSVDPVTPTYTAPGTGLGQETYATSPDAFGTDVYDTPYSAGRGDVPR